MHIHDNIVQTPSQVPDFFIIGAPKSGTTSLYRYLQQHPAIFMPTAKKETGFFSPDLFSPQRVTNPKVYSDLFRHAAPHQLKGEASTGYLHSERAAGLIGRHCPNARFIAMLRNPVEMAYALHSELLWLGRERIISFNAALASEAHRRHGQELPDRKCSSRTFLYREWMDYATQLERYVARFGRDRLHILLYEEFAKDPLGTTQNVYRFLGVEGDFIPALQIHNVSKVVRNAWLLRLIEMVPADVQIHLRTRIPQPILDPMIAAARWVTTRKRRRPPLDPQLRRELWEEIRPSVSRLEALLDKDLNPYWEKN